MPSFDAVSKIDLQELDNAINQAKKELVTRYDFQGTHTDLVLSEDKRSILIKANSEGRLDAAFDVLQGKFIKRGISLRCLERKDVEKAPMGHVKQLVLLQQGIAVEKARELIKVLKESKLKVQASIQGDELRVTGKKRDDLQEAIAFLRGQQEVQKVDLQFTNFRD